MGGREARGGQGQTFIRRPWNLRRNIKQDNSNERMERAFISVYNGESHAKRAIYNMVVIMHKRGKAIQAKT